MKNFLLNYRLLGLIVAGALAITVAGCGDRHSGTTPEHLLISVLPDQNETTIRKRYKPLLDYVSKSVGIPYKLKIPNNYQQIVDWFSAEKTNLALFGGYTYVIAHQRFGAEPVALRDVDGRFRSLVVVRSSLNAKSLQDLRGKKFAFGSKLSTSGHLMPRHYFGTLNIDPDSYFSEIQYSGAHDKTAYLVQQGKVDAGVANSGIVLEMFQSGLLNKNKVKVLWESPVFPNYVWATSPGIDQHTKDKIREAFLSLDPGNLEHLEILRSVGAGYYLPANHKKYLDLEQAIRILDPQGKKNG